ncbi:hypothetical protein D3C75_1282850 [compost metagenome]
MIRMNLIRIHILQAGKGGDQGQIIGTLRTDNIDAYLNIKKLGNLALQAKQLLLHFTQLVRSRIS